jgi:hypothetical protein
MKDITRCLAAIAAALVGPGILTACGSGSSHESAAAAQFVAIGKQTSPGNNSSLAQVQTDITNAVSRLKAATWPQAASADVIALESVFQSLLNDINSGNQAAFQSDVQKGQTDSDAVWHDLGGRGTAPGWNS